MCIYYLEQISRRFLYSLHIKDNMKLLNEPEPEMDSIGATSLAAFISNNPTEITTSSAIAQPSKRSQQVFAVFTLMFLALLHIIF